MIRAPLMLRGLGMLALLAPAACSLPHAEVRSDGSSLDVVRNDVADSETMVTPDIVDVTSEPDVTAMMDADAGDGGSQPDADAGMDVVRESGADAEAGVDAAPDAVADAGPDVVDTGVCPMSTTLCGASCVDTTTSLLHCGRCNNACAATDGCRAGTCVTARDCAELARLRGGSLPTAMYSIDHDGIPATATVNVLCDMSTLGGPWTVVFTSNATPLNAGPEAADRWIFTADMATRSTKMLVAYRDSTGALVDAATAATSAIPPMFRTMNPFATERGEIRSFPVSINGVDTTTTLYFGTRSFSNSCADAWSPAMTFWGRFCMTGTRAPFFSSWAESSEATDSCVASNQPFNAASCTNDRRFTIAVAP